MTRSLTMSPVDILNYQNELVRTGKYIPLGRMQKISIEPADDWTAPPNDPVIAKFGRMIDLRDRFLPIAQSPDRSMILVTAPLVDRAGRVSLPDVPDPGWTPGVITKEELEGQDVTLSFAESRLAEAELKGDLRAAAQWRSARDNVKNGHPVRMPYERPIEKDMARLLPQRLEDRTVKMLEGTNYMVFQPLINLAFQPEIEKRLVGTAWTIRFAFNAADSTHPALLVDRKTGETHFFGGIYDIFGPLGDES